MFKERSTWGNVEALSQDGRQGGLFYKGLDQGPERRPEG